MKKNPLKPTKSGTKKIQQINQKLTQQIKETPNMIKNRFSTNRPPSKNHRGRHHGATTIQG